MESIERGPFTAVIPDGTEPHSPVVVLMGWAGATDRLLSKFSDMLAEEGLVSVRSTQPLSVLFSPTVIFRRKWAASLLDFLEELSLSPPRPLVLYSFSNGGATVVEQIQNLVETNPRYKHYQQLIAGLVFDSAPAFIPQSKGNNLGTKVLEASIPPGLHRVAALAAFKVSSWIAPFDDKRQQRFWGNMLRLGQDRPQLFLHSEDDPLCDASKLTELIEEKKRRRQRVTAYKWERSEHVGHFKLHRRQYLSMLLPFLRGLQSGAVAQSKL